MNIINHNGIKVGDSVVVDLSDIPEDFLQYYDDMTQHLIRKVGTVLSYKAFPNSKGGCWEVEFIGWNHGHDGISGDINIRNRWWLESDAIKRIKE